jgi:hypothetical protein
MKWKLLLLIKNWIFALSNDIINILPLVEGVTVDYIPQYHPPQNHPPQYHPPKGIQYNIKHTAFG